MITDVLNAIVNLGGNIANLLPLSPFTQIEKIKVSNDVLGAIAWIVPFNEIIALLEAWVLAIAVWYVAQKILRWSKQIA
jgi:hypothetical protein